MYLGAKRRYINTLPFLFLFMLRRWVGLTADDRLTHLKSGYEQWRYSSDGRQPVLEHVVQHDVIEGQDVLHLDVSESVLGRGEVAEGVRDQHAAVVPLHAVKQSLNAQTDRRLDRRLIQSVVRRPPTNLRRSHNNAIVDHTSAPLPAATEWSRLLLNDVICSEPVTVHC